MRGLLERMVRRLQGADEQGRRWIRGWLRELLYWGCVRWLSRVGCSTEGCYRGDCCRGAVGEGAVGERAVVEGLL
jgi:hypothetical protein